LHERPIHKKIKNKNNYFFIFLNYHYTHWFFFKKSLQCSISFKHPKKDLALIRGHTFKNYLDCPNMMQKLENYITKWLNPFQKISINRTDLSLKKKGSLWQRNSLSLSHIRDKFQTQKKKKGWLDYSWLNF
jgi:hypothetical protein